MDSNAERWSDCLVYAAKSDVGLRRANNQDSMAVALAADDAGWQRAGHLFMVADGMGAHAAGELASKLATDIVPLVYQKRLEGSPPEALGEAIRDANQQIFDRGQASEDFRGMGTTGSILVLLPQGAVLGHVGDSRVYRLRAGQLEQLTFDHSLVWELRAAGRTGPDESLIPKNVITRSLGPHAEVQVDIEGPHPVLPGDTFLLCSDGLSGPVEDDEIGKILVCMEPDDAVRSLIDLALLRGGPDNITVVCACVLDPNMVDRHADEGPSREKKRPPRPPIHPAVWSLLGIFSLGAICLGAFDQWLPGLICLVGAVMAGVFAWIQRYGGSDGYEPTGPLGRGPYTTTSAAPDRDFAEKLAETVQELREAGTQHDWTVDWSRFNTHARQAEQARATNDFSTAVRESCHAISFMMAELKTQRRRDNQGPSDSVL